MGYTKEYIIGFCEFWVAVIGVFIIMQNLPNNGLGSCRHLRGIGDNIG
jgi:hypothetical protein